MCWRKEIMSAFLCCKGNSSCISWMSPLATSGPAQEHYTIFAPKNPQGNRASRYDIHGPLHANLNDYGAGSPPKLQWATSVETLVVFPPYDAAAIGTRGPCVPRSSLLSCVSTSLIMTSKTWFATAHCSSAYEEGLLSRACSEQPAE